MSPLDKVKEQYFMEYFTSKESCNFWEYRCLPALGFGGKIKYDGFRVYASMYPEDSTPSREKLLNDINLQLKEVLDV